MNHKNENYKTTRRDLFFFSLLIVVFLFSIVLDSNYGCEPHDLKPQCDYQSNQN